MMNLVRDEQRKWLLCLINNSNALRKDNYKKLILTEEETYQLLVAFYREALDFLKLPRERHAEILNGCNPMSNGRQPISVDFSDSRIYVVIPFFRMLVEEDPNYRNDGPTIYRTYGYQLAYVWHTYLTTGKKLNIPLDKSCVFFAQSLSIIKGLPIHNRPKLSSDMIKIIGYDPNDISLILKMLRENFKMDCVVKRAWDYVNQNYIEFISFSQNESQYRQEQFQNLYNENIARPLPSLMNGELGSETNPFENVDEAAAYILKLEGERLASDRYRQHVDDEQYYYDYQTGSFRISWASPNVSFYNIENANRHYFVANQLSQTRIAIPPRFSLKPTLRDNKFLFRGQAEFYSPCKPSLFRNSEKRYYVDDIIQINELEVLLRDHPLVKLFEQGFFLMNEFIRFKINFIGLSQHYYNKTHLLDLTSDMEVAKFFAVTTFDMDNDCYVEYKGDKLGVLYYYDIKADTFAGREGRNYVVDTIGKQPFMRSGNQSGFLINLGRDDDFNILPDVRYVFFKHNPSITSRIFKESMNGDKYMPQEMLRAHWYKRMIDENERVRISYEALKLNYRENPGESHSRILRELRNKGYKIYKDSVPKFTEDELGQYYKHSIEIWEGFCSDVYFYGPEGELLKKHLINLPNDERYRWAFYR